jgi:hypothetical protein
MPSETRRLRASRGASLVVLLASLACGPLLGEDTVSTEITGPASGLTVQVGETLEIASTSSADAGLARVELLVDGAVVRRDEPPAGNPPTFRLLQAWVPLAEGEVTVSVVAYDVEGRASEAATITIFVGEAAAGVTPTPAEDVEIGGCTLNASYVADITIPDDTEIAPGASFVKGWRIQNSGTCDWGPGFELVFVSGDQMGGPASVAISPTPAGNTVDVSVELEAPTTYGTHRGNWRARSDEAQMFGSTFWVQIVVPAPPTVTPTPADTPTPTPTWSMPLITMIAPTFMVFLPYTQHVSATVTVPAGTWAATTAVCPGGGLVVGGGYDAHWNVEVYSHYKSGDGWRGAGWNHGGSDLAMTVHAVCLRNVSGTTSMVTSSSVSVTPGNWGKAVAECPAGSVVTGGGWAVLPTGDMHVYNSSKFGNGWEVYAFNTGSGNSGVVARAICLEGTTGSVSEVTNSISLGAGSVGEVECSCSSGLNVSGGFAGPFQYAKLYITSPDLSVSGQWSNWGRNTDTSSRNFYCYADCLTF